MKNWKFIILILVLPKIFFGQNVTCKFTNYGKLHICNYEQFEKAESNKKAALIGQMALEYLLADHDDTAKICPILIEFQHDFQHVSAPYVFASFDTLNVPGIIKEGKTTKGLRLSFRATEHSAALVIKLLAYCLHEVKANNYSQTKKFETEIDYLTHYNNAQVDQVLQNAHLRPSKPWLSETIYAYQNDKFLFFHPSEGELSDFDRMDHISKNTFLTVNSVKEIVGSTKTGSMVFVSDSTFYYIPSNTKKFDNKLYTIPSLIANREPIKRVVFEKDSLQKVFLYFINDKGHEQKVLYLPTKARIFNNYKVLENEAILASLEGKSSSKTVDLIIIATVLFSLFLVAFVVAYAINKED